MLYSRNPSWDCNSKSWLRGEGGVVLWAGPHQHPQQVIKLQESITSISLAVHLPRARPYWRLRKVKVEVPAHKGSTVWPGTRARKQVARVGCWVLGKEKIQGQGYSAVGLLGSDIHTCVVSSQLQILFAFPPVSPRILYRNVVTYF